MTMLIELDPESSDPPYEQIRTQITGLVLTGELRPGDRLPSIRQLAGDLGLASGTVARGYRELEAEGVVRSRGARGTAVVGPPTDEDQWTLIRAAKVFADSATASGATLDDAVGALRVAFASRRPS